MTLPLLTIIPAGAGSGKTYSIQTTLAQWVVDGQVRPDSIIAVTFTEAAAAELRGRIRTELIGKKRPLDALQLQQSYISTIHGFGLRLLSEFAFDAGLNPSPRLLTEDEENVLIRLALSGTNHSVPIMKDLQRFGYRYDFNSNSSPEDAFRGAVLELMNKLRSIGRLEKDDHLAAQAIARIQNVYGPTGDATLLQQRLHHAVQCVLKQFPEDVSAYCKTKGVAKKLKDDFNLLRQAANVFNLNNDWKLWQQLRGLQTSTPRNPLPEGYDRLIQEVISAADSLLDHPGPLTDASDHAGAMLQTAQDSLDLYAQRKMERGLLDYTDMLAQALKMLMDKPAVLSLLKERIDCLVIDEFQDTNPLQFALLWMFHRAGIPTLIVGDLKQAIMGFQNADARLLEELQKNNPSACRPLTGNWRTHPNLMPWVNAIGRGLFGSDYTALEPKADFPSSLSSLEVIDFTARATQQTRAEHTVARIKALLDEGGEVFDRITKKMRPVRGGDIAVICPRNSRLTTYAEILRSVGLRTRTREEGWFESRIIQLAYHALSLVADPTDRHAALYLAVTELGTDTLESALTTMIKGEWPASPAITALLQVRDGATGRSVSTVMAETLAALDLLTTVSIWPEAPQARANLLRLQAEALEFENGNRDALASGGYYGTELKSFLSWLRTRAERDNTQPPYRVQDEDAIELVTWHRSKGREWPIVVVAATDSEILNPLPSLDINYEDFSDLDQILQKARIDISPQYVAPEKNEPLLETLWPVAKDSATRLLYVALTRSREKIILEWPSYLDNGKDRTSLTYWELLVEKTGMVQAANQLSLQGQSYPCRAIRAGKDRHELFESELAPSRDTLPVIGRRALIKSDLPSHLTPETIRPSLIEAEEKVADVPVSVQTYAPPLQFNLDLPANTAGTLLHRCFELQGHITDADQLRQVTGYAWTDDQFLAICSQVEQFHKYLMTTFTPDALRHEVAVLSTDINGSVINGLIDLLVETPDGLWIIDHKSDTTDDRQTRLYHHLPQLRLYQQVLAKLRPDKPVAGVAINWIRYGEVMLVDDIF
ncbi:UvrD-helicase domain-containing protein [Pelovirga terrestris]|uniref:DNA 3'-5' helicase n=1 Tax=Pelovirga terrestris TaxID=2771352 RepID=A0A8J6UGL9_9BACT|nr:UvrD-helicase domain-containing protein [Pelovirga terrestris]MBD1400003.1 UvrD-helicase domain-containing protein [Pelovirga terrestris]